MSKKILAILMAVAMAFSLLPATALAVETNDGTDGGTPTVTVPDGKAKLNGTEYNSVFEAVQAADKTEMNTIYLGKGTYTLYGTVSGNAPTNNYTSGKRFTFIGAGRNETTWMIGAPVPDPGKLGTEYNADYSFGGCTKVVFQNMTLSSYYEKENDTKDSNYLGFAHTIDTEVVDCTINGLTFYWGYTSAMFKNTTFNCPDGDYAIWTYSSTEMTFDNCTFNSSGKVINVYNENSAADYTINFNNCTVNNTGTPAKQVLNINDSLVKGFTINITGDTVLKGFDTTTIVDNKTCSRLFGFGGKADSNNNKKTIVKFGGTTVWENGAMVDANAFHNSGMTADGVSYNNGVTSAGDSLYAEGYKDDAFTTKTTTQGKRTDTTKTCNYCGWSEKSSTYAWDVSRSKTAKNLDSNYESKVTLSIPSSEEQLVSDVLFILDESSCSESVKASVNSMLDELYKQIENSGAKIKVGAVQFRGNVTTLPLTELTDKTKTEITSFMSSRPEVGGTNMSAGLLEAQKMLDNDTSVMDGRKYVILVSDGITYIWDDETTDAQENLGVNFANADAPNNAMLAGPDGWDVKYGKSYIPENWESHFNGIGSMMSTTIQNKASNYERGDNATTGKPFVVYGEKEQYTSTVDIALYKSYNAYKALQEKYNTYAVCSGVEKDMTDFPFGPSFMTYLADGKNVTFDGIQNDILYTVSAGSRVEDYMGYVEGDYNFDFINDASKLSITVGTGENKETLEAAVIGKNHYGFGPVKKVQEPEAGQEMTTSEISYRYELEYVPGEKKNDEHFIWRINVPVSNFAPVALTYSVKLVNPKSASGTYGQYDEDGSKNYSGLYTNNSATLYPMDSKGQSGVPENFLKPTVSYTVSGGNSGGNNGGSSKPSLNTKDHYGYIIGYPVDYYTGQPTTDQTKKPVRPEGKITRAEVATIYFRMLTDESRTKFWSQSNSYSDVKAGDWFNNAVSTLSNAGIIAGYEDGSFKPNGYITRAEFATIAARFFDVTYNGKDLFPDISGHWAKDYINQAANKGFVNGYEDGTFKPDRNITRAEAVTLVNRTLDRHPDKNHFTKDMLVWPDNMDQTKWYYADMQEATNSHTYQMKENSDKTKYENWTKTLPIRNWEALEKAWSNANSSQGNGNVV